MLILSHKRSILDHKKIPGGSRGFFYHARLFIPHELLPKLWLLTDATREGSDRDRNQVRRQVHYARAIIRSIEVGEVIHTSNLCRESLSNVCLCRNDARITPKLERVRRTSRNNDRRRARECPRNRVHSVVRRRCVASGYDVVTARVLKNNRVQERRGTVGNTVATEGKLQGVQLRITRGVCGKRDRTNLSEARRSRDNRRTSDIKRGAKNRLRITLSIRQRYDSRLVRGRAACHNRGRSRDREG